MCVQVLLIDIDDTLIRQRPETTNEYELLDLIQQQAQRAGLTAEEIDTSVQQVLDSTYWRWADFLEALRLPQDAFWQLADGIEARRTTRIDDQILQRLNRLHDHGYQLAIASNNPVDGIHHKLRLAGISPRQQIALFTHYFGTDNCRANKAEAAFWQFVLGQLRMPASQIAVVGDNPLEDGTVPSHVGIRRWFPIREHGTDTWPALEQLLLKEKESTVGGRQQ